jgi:hypothetical protein
VERRLVQRPQLGGRERRRREFLTPDHDERPIEIRSPGATCASMRQSDAASLSVQAYQSSESARSPLISNCHEPRTAIVTPQGSAVVTH